MPSRDSWMWEAERGSPLEVELEVCVCVRVRVWSSVCGHATHAMSNKTPHLGPSDTQCTKPFDVPIADNC
jgi:hypothetical protein